MSKANGSAAAVEEPVVKKCRSSGSFGSIWVVMRTPRQRSIATEANRPPRSGNIFPAEQRNMPAGGLRGSRRGSTLP